MRQCEILERLSDLDEETLTHDPATPEGQAELARIRGEQEELEATLAELSHMEWLETTWG